MSANGKRRRWTAAEKLRIVLAGMQPGVEVSELCRREGLHPTLYYVRTDNASWSLKGHPSATVAPANCRPQPPAAA